MKRLAVLGSTGSIGVQTLEVVHHCSERFSVVGLAAGRNVDLLARQAQEFRPLLVSFHNTGDGHAESSLLSSSPGCQLVSLEEMAGHPDVDLVVMATSGMAGLAPTLAAIRAGKNVALANKEVLVMAGEVVMAEATKYNVDILPVDSEHSAIWQCLQGESRDEVSRLILTASGGPFYRHTMEQMETITPEAALRHPTWKMGEKVTVDSATLMNKGMEVVEARWLFGLPPRSIQILVHPGSIVHSMVEFVDGSVKAQLSMPDMRLPIQYALSYPERVSNRYTSRMDWTGPVSLDFEPPDLSRFPCLALAIEAAEAGGTSTAVLAAADEVAVGLFLSHRIGFLDIARLVEHTLGRHCRIDHASLEDILAADAWARESAETWKAG